jgi:predicted ATPase
MDLFRLRALPVRWREQAEAYERDGAFVSAEALLHRVAAELDEALAEWWVEPLSVEAAADEVNVTYEAMSKRLRRGSVPNVGQQGAPLVRRCDLHGGGGRQEETSVSGVLDRVLGR